MDAIDTFSLASHAGPYERWPSTTALFAEGRPTGTSVPGYVLEAQYRCADGYLLITSWDCPFEEANDFVLLDERFARRAHASLGVPYGSFLLESHTPAGPRELVLRYDGKTVYRLTIHPPAGWRRWFSLRLRREGA